MRIAYITHAHANMGGMDKILSIKANWLVNHGYEVCIITNSKKDITPFFFFDPKINIFYMQSPQKGEKKEYINELSRILNDIKPDIAISTGMRNARYLYQVDYPCKKILESHFSKYQKRYKLAYFDQFSWGHYITNFFVKLKDKIVEKYDKFVLLTDEDRYSYAYLNNTITIPNPLSEYPTTHSTCTNKSAIAVGRLASQKGFDFMIEIWKEVARKHPDWTLNIYGEGKKEKSLKSKINKYHLQDKIIIHPFSKNVYELYNNSSVFLFTSRYEGLPLVLMEAMSAGLPIISYDCKCGPKDIINDGKDGYIIPFGNQTLFAEKLSILLDNEDLRTQMGKYGINKMQNFDIDTIMHEWIKLFKQLLA